jgi:hypothetical protein
VVAVSLGDDFFKVGVMQDGERVEIEGKSVRLSKSPFTLLFSFRIPLPLFAHFSLDSAAWEGLQAGRNLHQIFGNPEPFQGLAEYDRNREQGVFVTSPDGRYGKTGAHYFTYEYDDYHRFDKVHIDKGIINAERRVAYLFLESEDEYIKRAVDEFEGVYLYITFLFSYRDFRQVDHLRIEFVD